MRLCKTAPFRVRLPELDRCRLAIREFVAQIKAQEPDTRMYFSLERQTSPGEFIHVMEFMDAGAEERHRNTPWVKAFVSILYPCTEGGVTFQDHRSAAST